MCGNKGKSWKIEGKNLFRVVYILLHTTLTKCFRSSYINMRVSVERNFYSVVGVTVPLRDGGCKRVSVDEYYCVTGNGLASRHTAPSDARSVALHDQQQGTPHSLSAHTPQPQGAVAPQRAGTHARHFLQHAPHPRVPGAGQTGQYHAATERFLEHSARTRQIRGQGLSAGVESLLRNCQALFGLLSVVSGQPGGAKRAPSFFTGTCSAGITVGTGVWTDRGCQCACEMQLRLSFELSFRGVSECDRCMLLQVQPSVSRLVVYVVQYDYNAGQEDDGE